MIENRLTLVITTHERHAFLARSLEHYADLACRRIVVDSSRDAFPGIDAFPWFDYRHVPGVGFATKLTQSLATVETPYVVLGADDDLLDLSALAPCVDFLDRNPDHSTAQGLFLFFLRGRNRVWGAGGYPLRDDWQIEEADPVARQHHLMSTYMHQVYAVQRTDILLEAYQRMNDRLLSNGVLMEFVVGLVATARGRHRTLPMFYCLRQSIPDSWSGGVGSTLSDLPQMYRDGRDPEEYERFLTLWEDLLIDSSTLDRGAARRAAIEGVEAYCHPTEVRRSSSPRKSMLQDLSRMDEEPEAWPVWCVAARRPIEEMVDLIKKHPACGTDTAVLDSLDEVDRRRPVHVYGSGSAGRALVGKLANAGHPPIAGYIDSFQSGTVDGIPRRRLSEYLAIRENGDQVLIAAEDRRLIRLALEEAGVRDFRDAYQLAMAP